MQNFGNADSENQLSPTEYDRFITGGCVPWTPGYHEYKWRKIQEAIEAGFENVVGTDKFGFRVDERVVELPWFISRLPAGKGTLLDAGSALNFDLILSHPSITAKRLFISTLAYEGTARTDLGISYIYEDLRFTCLKDNFFDYIACISTLEHIGLDNTFLYTSDPEMKDCATTDYLKVLDTLKRLLRKDGVLYLTTPFGVARNHGWFQVFDADMVDGLIERFNPTHYTETIFKYEFNGWGISDRKEATGCTCFDIHVQKDYEPDLLAFSRGIVCLELVK